MKKLLKKHLIFLEVIILMLSLCGCALSSIFEDNTQSELNTTKEVAIQIIQIISQSDTEKFKEYFTEEALKTSDFETGLNYIFDIFDGEFETAKDGGTSVLNSFNSGKQAKMAKALYDISTDQGEYVIYFEYFLKDEISSNQNKIQKLKLVNKTDILDEYNYNYGHEYDRLGIYNPDWDTE